MSRKPGLIIMSGNHPALLFDAAWGIQPTASFLIRFRGEQERTMRGMIQPPPTVVTLAHALHVRTGTEIFFNRDNDPDLAQKKLIGRDLSFALHLGLSFWQGRASNDNPQGEVRGELRRVRPAEESLRTRWIEAFFGNNLDRLWVCPPLNDEGREFDIKHYRLFTDENWVARPPLVGIEKSPLQAMGWHRYGEPEQSLPAEMAAPAKDSN
jgi:hypothetical protein